MRHDRSEDGEDQREDEEEQLDLATAAARFGAVTGPAAKAHGAHDNFRQDHNGAEHDGGQGHELDVPVLEVAHLVRDDALEFVAVQPVEQAGGDANGAVGRFAAHCKSVGGRIINQMEAGNKRQARCQLHFFDDVEQLGAVLPFEFLGERAVQ